MGEMRLKELLREVVGEVFEEKTAIFATKDDLRVIIWEQPILKKKSAINRQAVRSGVLSTHKATVTPQKDSVAAGKCQSWI